MRARLNQIQNSRYRHELLNGPLTIYLCRVQKEIALDSDVSQVWTPNNLPPHIPNLEPLNWS